MRDRVIRAADAHKYVPTKSDLEPVQFLLPRFEYVDLEAVAEGGIQPPPMLLDEWLLDKQYCVLEGASGAGKTWIAYWWALQVMRNGGTVCLLDEEVGRDQAADRFLRLGAEPHELRALSYLERPNLTMRDVDNWAREAGKHKWNLTIGDALADMVVAAGFSENSADDITSLVKGVFEAVLPYGTFLGLDHTGHTSLDRARGSSAKIAKSKLTWHQTVEKKFDATRRGLVVLDCNRTNNFAAPVVNPSVLAMGPSPDGQRFLIERQEGVVPITRVSEGDNVDRLREFFADGEPHTREEVQEAVGISKATFFRLIPGLIGTGEIEAAETCLETREKQWRLAQ